MFNHMATVVTGGEVLIPGEMFLNVVILLHVGILKVFVQVGGGSVMMSDNLTTAMAHTFIPILRISHIVKPNHTP